jgi:RTA1 like protein
LQGVGGGIASVAWKENTSMVTGDNIMIAGLSFQVFTLLIFIICSIDFLINTMRRYRKFGDEAFSQHASKVAVRGSWMFKGFVAALSLATICIFWRSVYRIAELSNGWSGPLMYKQDLFIGLEGVLIAVACVALNIFHPNVCFKDMMETEELYELQRRRHP